MIKPAGQHFFSAWNMVSYKSLHGTVLNCTTFLLGMWRSFRERVDSHFMKVLPHAFERSCENSKVCLLTPGGHRHRITEVDLWRNIELIQYLFTILAIIVSFKGQHTLRASNFCSLPPFHILSTLCWKTSEENLPCLKLRLDINLKVGNLFFFFFHWELGRLGADLEAVDSSFCMYLELSISVVALSCMWHLVLV